VFGRGRFAARPSTKPAYCGLAYISAAARTFCLPTIRSRTVLTKLSRCWAARYSSEAMRSVRIPRVSRCICVSILSREAPGICVSVLANAAASLLKRPRFSRAVSMSPLSCKNAEEPGRVWARRRSRAATCCVRLAAFCVPAAVLLNRASRCFSMASEDPRNTVEYAFMSAVSCVYASPQNWAWDLSPWNALIRPFVTLSVLPDSLAKSIRRLRTLLMSESVSDVTLPKSRKDDLSLSIPSKPLSFRRTKISFTCGAAT